ncbi:STAS domain-containing protein [Streptomyces sp. Je 1-332]|uniref:STAS domain-containing protein n=1 Tax=Streptomyces sp. Je 1-332 TaxID=3231270 RepID=UPI003459591B
MGISDAHSNSDLRSNFGSAGLPDPFRCARSYRRRGVTVVEFCGAIDVSSAPGVQVHVDAATASQGAQVVVDLRAVEFFDCSALSLLCRTRRRALKHGGHMTVVCTRPWHLRIIKAAGLNTLFKPVSTI